jgi:hypothetical protein
MPLIAISYIALALALGYGVTVLLSMAATFGITAASRSFVSKNHRVQRGYKYAQEGMWLLCSVAGGYAAAIVNQGSHPVMVASGLVVMLVGVLWLNVWEMRQRGLGHQILMSVATAVGVVAGFMLRLR